MSGTVRVPSNVSSVSVSDGAHAVNSGVITSLIVADFDALVYPYTQPTPVSNPSSTTLQISLPPNITSITVNSVVYTPDGTKLNTITGPTADMTIVATQDFILVDFV